MRHGGRRTRLNLQRRSARCGRGSTEAGIRQPQDNCNQKILADTDSAATGKSNACVLFVKRAAPEVREREAREQALLTAWTYCKSQGAPCEFAGIAKNTVIDYNQVDQAAATSWKVDGTGSGWRNNGEWAGNGETAARPCNYDLWIATSPVRAERRSAA